MLYVRPQPCQPCDLRFSRLLAGRSLAYQCAVAVHEIGHAGMGLEHTSDRTNVMFKYTIVPRFCRQTFPQWVGSRRGRADHGRGMAMMRGLIYDTPLDLELIRSRATWSSPNSELDAVTEPVIATPSQPINGEISANMPPAPAAHRPIVTVCPERFITYASASTVVIVAIAARKRTSVSP